MLLQLMAVAGDRETGTRSIPLPEGRVLTIGRSFQSDIQVSEASVARRQCDLEIREGTVWLLDYGFTRGKPFGESVSINGRPISDEVPTWRPLQCGDEIRIGTVVFRLETT